MKREPTIDPISYEEVTSSVLETVIYPNMYKNYYWSDDFSAENYVALAMAGFISVTEEYKGKEFLIPEIQYKYVSLRGLQNNAQCTSLLADFTRTRFPSDGIFV